jgi:hypothetical protein
MQVLTPLILATQEAEIRRIKVPGQSRQIVHKTLPGQNPSQKVRCCSRCGLSPNTAKEKTIKKQQNTVQILSFPQTAFTKSEI